MIKKITIEFQEDKNFFNNKNKELTQDELIDLLFMTDCFKETSKPSDYKSYEEWEKRDKKLARIFNKLQTLIKNSSNLPKKKEN